MTIPWQESNSNSERIPKPKLESRAGWKASPGFVSSIYVLDPVYCRALQFGAWATPATGLPDNL